MRDYIETVVQTLLPTSQTAMDLPTENAGLNEADLNNVFGYAPQATAVVRFLTTDEVRHYPPRGA